MRGLLLVAHCRMPACQSESNPFLIPYLFKFGIVRTCHLPPIVSWQKAPRLCNFMRLFQAKHIKIKKWNHNEPRALCLLNGCESVWFSSNINTIIISLGCVCCLCGGGRGTTNKKSMLICKMEGSITALHTDQRRVCLMRSQLTVLTAVKGTCAFHTAPYAIPSCLYTYLYTVYLYPYRFQHSQIYTLRTINDCVVVPERSCSAKNKTEKNMKKWKKQNHFHFWRKFTTLNANNARCVACMRAWFAFARCGMKCASEILKTRRSSFLRKTQPKPIHICGNQKLRQCMRARIPTGRWVCHAHDAAPPSPSISPPPLCAHNDDMIIIVVISMSSCPEMMQFSRKIYSKCYSFSLIYAKQHSPFVSLPFGGK